MKHSRDHILVVAVRAGRLQSERRELLHDIVGGLPISLGAVRKNIILGNNCCFVNDFADRAILSHVQS